MKNQLRIGVFVCECGGEITDALEMDEILRKVSLLPDVVLVERVPYGCGLDGEEAIRQGIKRASLNRLVLLACSPRIMEKKFQRMCVEGGLNPSLLEMVNLRDQCVRVHQDDPARVDGKAWDLVKLGLARARYLVPLETLRAGIHPQVAVIGGGITGMTAALALAEQGIRVKLIEKEEVLGGTQYRPDRPFPSLENGVEMAGKLAEQVCQSEYIDVLTETEPVAVSGCYGHYEIELKGKRENERIGCGAAILAVGARELKPEGYYGYGENGQVITQSELEGKLAEDPTLVGLDQVVMIQCVGARNKERPYCGRICCMSAVHNAILLKKRKPALAVTILHRDMPTEPGPDRSMLDQARELGVKFLRFTEAIPLQVTASRVAGKSLQGQPFELPYELLVLSTPLVPHPSSQALARAFRIPLDQFGFLPDTLPNLKPHQYIEPCVHVAGSAHWPCSVAEARYQAYTRAARIASLLRQREVFSTRATATVNLEACRGCATCLEWCPFDVPLMQNGERGIPVSFIDPFLCKGCGSCVAHCPSAAVTIPNLGDELFQGAIEAALSEPDFDGEEGLKIIAFLCDWSGYAVADLAGTRGKSLPREVIPIRIPCAGRISSGLILRAFALGADGVLVCTCEQGDCHYLSGNSHCAAVTADTEALLSLVGIARERFRMARVSAVDIAAFGQILEDFLVGIEKLKPRISDPLYAEAKVP